MPLMAARAHARAGRLTKADKLCRGGITQTIARRNERAAATHGKFETGGVVSGQIVPTRERHKRVVVMAVIDLDGKFP